MWKRTKPKEDVKRAELLRSSPPCDGEQLCKVNSVTH